MLQSLSWAKRYFPLQPLSQVIPSNCGRADPQLLLSYKGLHNQHATSPPPPTAPALSKSKARRGTGRGEPKTLTPESDPAAGARNPAPGHHGDGRDERCGAAVLLRDGLQELRGRVRAEPQRRRRTMHLELSSPLPVRFPAAWLKPSTLYDVIWLCVPCVRAEPDAMGRRAAGAVAGAGRSRRPQAP